MSTTVMFLLHSSLRGGLMILAVLLLRVLMRKVPKRYTCFLWTAVWLRLALPFAVRSRFSLLPGWLSTDRSTAAPLPVQAAPIPQLETELSGAAVPVSKAASLDWPLLIWAMGLAALLLLALTRYLLLKRRVREAIPLRDRLCLCDWVETPFLLGLLRPRIYLPSGVDEADIPLIAAHEMAHLRRGDPWRKLGAFLLTAVYWFQPLVWVAFALYRRDLELACDEQTCAGYDAGARDAYVGALLRASRSGRRVWTASLGFGSAPVRKRIEAILHPSGCGRRKLALAAMLCAVVLLTLTVEPVQAARTAPEAEQPLSESTLEAELPPSETASAPPAAEQPEAGRSEHPETTGWEIRTDKDEGEAKWFLVANQAGDASVLLLPDGSSEALYGEAVIICYDEDSGQTYAILSGFWGGDAP